MQCPASVGYLIVGHNNDDEKRAIKAEEELAPLRVAFKSNEKELHNCLAEVGQLRQAEEELRQVMDTESGRLCVLASGLSGEFICFCSFDCRLLY